MTDDTRYAGVGIGEPGFAAACARARMAARDFRIGPSAFVAPELSSLVPYFEPTGIVCPRCPRNDDCCQAPARPSSRAWALAVVDAALGPELARRLEEQQALFDSAWEAE